MFSWRPFVGTILLTFTLLFSACAPGQSGAMTYSLPDGSQVYALGERLMEFSYSLTTVTGAIATEQEFGFYYKVRTYEADAEQANEDRLADTDSQAQQESSTKNTNP